VKFVVTRLAARICVAAGLGAFVGDLDADLSGYVSPTFDVEGLLRFCARFGRGFGGFFGEVAKRPAGKPDAGQRSLEKPSRGVPLPLCRKLGQLAQNGVEGVGPGGVLGCPFKRHPALDTGAGLQSVGQFPVSFEGNIGGRRRTGTHRHLEDGVRVMRLLNKRRTVRPCVVGPLGPCFGWLEAQIGDGADGAVVEFEPVEDQFLECHQ
jgi:hypothetical protein